MPKIGRPTSRDVAEAAGVSQSTVSIVLTGKWAGRVSPATAQAVRTAAEHLGYRPNPAARNLRLGRTRTVLLVVPTLDNPFFGPVYTGAASVAARHGLAVLVRPWPHDGGAEPGEEGENEHEAMAEAGLGAYEAIDGILASSVAAGALDGLLDRSPPVPLVMLDSDPAGGVPTVNFEVAEGMRQVAAHLAGLGHRRFGHLAAAVDAWTFQARGAALSTVVAGLPGGSLVRKRTAIEMTAARAAAHSLLSLPGPERPTALACDDDLIAAGAYKAAGALGLRIPEDVSITGFDDVLLAEAIQPELTTVRLPAAESGARGMTVLLELLEGGDPRPAPLPARLVVRASTAAPPDSPSAPAGGTGRTG